MSKNIADQIDSLLNSVKQPESRSGFNAASFRDDVVEYLDATDAEIEDDPDLARRSHWNLVMDDGELGDAFFAMMIIHPDGLEILAGTGDPYDVREVTEAYTIVQVDKVRLALIAKFPCQSLKINRPEAEQWLRRGLGLNQ